MIYDINTRDDWNRIIAEIEPVSGLGPGNGRAIRDASRLARFVGSKGHSEDLITFTMRFDAEPKGLLTGSSTTSRIGDPRITIGVERSK